jgi:putative tryptophan/tyrosine transport system substrate-binding protein
LVIAQCTKLLDNLQGRCNAAPDDALFIGGDTFSLGQRDQLVLLAERNSLATIYPQREYVDASGLASYGADIPSAYQLAGTYVGRILKGEMPAALDSLQHGLFPKH